MPRGRPDCCHPPPAPPPPPPRPSRQGGIAADTRRRSLRCWEAARPRRCRLGRVVRWAALRRPTAGRYAGPLRETADHSGVRWQHLARRRRHGRGTRRAVRGGCAEAGAARRGSGRPCARHTTERWPAMWSQPRRRGGCGRARWRLVCAVFHIDVAGGALGRASGTSWGRPPCQRPHRSRGKGARSPTRSSRRASSAPGPGVSTAPPHPTPRRVQHPAASNG